MIGYRELWIRWIQVILVLAGLLLLARPASHAIRRSYQAWQAERAWQDARKSPAAILQCGDPAAWLEIPTADVDTLVVQHGDEEDLLAFPSLWLHPPGEPR